MNLSVYKKNFEIERLRGFSILLVMGFHFFPTLKLGNFELFRNGASGVDFFFVISGFLIGGQLFELFNNQYRNIHERMKCLWPGLRDFYIRRFYRIVPLVSLWLALFVIFTPIKWEEVIHALIFSVNFAVIEEPRHTLGYLWSLSVEEQFYLFLPLVFLLGSTSRFRLMVVFATLIIFFSFRWILLGKMEGESDIWGSYHIFFHTRYDGLLIGVCLSYLQKNSKLFHHFKIPGMLGQALLLFCLALPLFDFSLFEKDWTNRAFPLAVSPWLAAICVYLASFQNGYVLNQPIVSRILEYLGSRSYGLYLSHIFFLQVVRYGEGILSLILAVATTELLFRLYERPLRNFGYFLTSKQKMREQQLQELSA